jgi:HK97 family phage major capsid protein
MNWKEQLKNKALVMKAMVDKAKAENRNFTPDEETIYAAHETELATIQAAIAAEEKVFARQASVDAILATSTGTLAAGREQPGAEIILAAEDRPWNSLGEQLVAVKNAARGNIDPRLTVKNAVTGLNEGVGSEGGFQVGTDLSGELIKKTYETGVLASKVQRIPISAGASGLIINGIDETSRASGSRWGGVQAYWGDEADAMTATKPKFRKIKLELKKLIGLCYATDELLEDSAALESIISQAFTEEFGFMLDEGILRGTGAGQLQGIMGSNSLVTVAKQGAQANGTILFENILNMWARLYAPSRANAEWYINQDIEPALYAMSLLVGTTGGVPVYMPAGGISGSPYSTLFGRPVIPIEQCSTLGAVGDIVLADLSQYAMIDKGGMKSATSIHVRFLNDEQVFRFTMRVDGQPKWNAAMTPNKGTNTQSPFITLAAR